METHLIPVSGSDSEQFKGLVHLGLFALAATVCSYNAMRFTVEKDAHHALNVTVYTALVLFELKQIRRHLIP